MREINLATGTCVLIDNHRHQIVARVGANLWLAIDPVTGLKTAIQIDDEGPLTAAPFHIAA